MHNLLKVRDVIFDESNHIERITIHVTDGDNIPDLWMTDLPITTATSNPQVHCKWTNDDALPLHTETSLLTELMEMDMNNETEKQETGIEGHREGYKEVPEYAPRDFEKGPWLDPNNKLHGWGKWHQDIYTAINVMAHGLADLEHVESAFIMLAEDEPVNYKEAMDSPNANKWKVSMNNKCDTLMGYHTWELIERPPDTNIVSSRWMFHIKRDKLGCTNNLKSQLVAQRFLQVPGLDFNETSKY